MMCKQESQEAGSHDAIGARTGLLFIWYVHWGMRVKMQWLILLGLLAFTKILGMDPKEADKVCRDTVLATKNKNVHSYFPQ
jgi:hypothetical protein